MPLDPTFRQALDGATAWARVRLTARQAPTLVRDFGARGGATSWRLAKLAQPYVERQLRSVDWRAVVGARLIALVEGRFALADGRDGLLASRT